MPYSALILFSFGILSCSTLFLDRSPLQTVEDLDLEAYMGKWYQVAAIPTSFQKKCVGETTAEYEKNDLGVKVVNSCVRKDGTWSVATGQARINGKFSEKSKLEVAFVKIFGHWIWFFSGDYWVMDVDKNLYAVVGHPGRKYLWILSRSPKMGREVLRLLADKIAKQEYDTCKIKITQEGELKGRSLCELGTTGC